MRSSSDFMNMVKAKDEPARSRVKLSRFATIIEAGQPRNFRQAEPAHRSRNAKNPGGGARDQLKEKVNTAPDKIRFAVYTQNLGSSRVNARGIQL